jgi:hypothetical protein
MKFSDLTINFDILSDHSDNGHDVLMELTDFLRARAAIEEEYGKKLRALIVDPNATLGRKLLMKKVTRPVDAETRLVPA